MICDLLHFSFHWITWSGDKIIEEQLAIRVAEAEQRLVAEYTAKATEEVAAIVARLEEENGERTASTESAVRQREAELNRKHEMMLLAANDRESKLQEHLSRCRKELGVCEAALFDARSELADAEQRRAGVMATMQASDERIDALEANKAMLEREISSARARVEEERRAAELRVAEEVSVARMRLEDARQQLMARDEKHKIEMEAVDSRVRKLIQSKDDIISKLQMQIEEIETIS